VFSIELYLYASLLFEIQENKLELKYSTLIIQEEERSLRLIYTVEAAYECRMMMANGIAQPSAQGSKQSWKGIVVQRISCFGQLSFLQAPNDIRQQI
jgi:hypothetical protein